MEHSVSANAGPPDPLIGCMSAVVGSNAAFRGHHRAGGRRIGNKPARFEEPESLAIECGEQSRLGSKPRLNRDGGMTRFCRSSGRHLFIDPRGEGLRAFPQHRKNGDPKADRHGRQDDPVDRDGPVFILREPFGSVFLLHHLAPWSGAHLFAHVHKAQAAMQLRQVWGGMRFVEKKRAPFREHVEFSR